MLMIQDVHIVIGREEVPFDDMYRDQLAPRIADDPGTRLAGFFWAPHGAGEGYEAVTLTAVADVASLERHQERLATGDLAACWSALEGMQRHIDSSLHLLAEWSPLAARELTSFEPGDHAPAIFRLDTYTVAGTLDESVDAVRQQVMGPSGATTVSPVASWSPYLGELDRPTVNVLGRVGSDDVLRSAFSEPTREWSGVPSLPGARRTTRLLRSASWSSIQ
jgi:hypothetical protein